MTMLLSCPWCGPRELEEFRFRSVAADGGEATMRPGTTAYAAVYERANVPESSIEYWQHPSDYAHRNEFVMTMRLAQAPLAEAHYLAP